MPTTRRARAARRTVPAPGRSGVAANARTTSTAAIWHQPVGPRLPAQQVDPSPCGVETRRDPIRKTGRQRCIDPASDRRRHRPLVRHRLATVAAGGEMFLEALALGRLELVQTIVRRTEHERGPSITAHSATFLLASGGDGVSASAPWKSASRGRSRCRPRKMRDMTVPIGTSSTTAISLYSRPSTS